MGNKKGFQLIELLIVLFLAVIIIGMVISVGFRAIKDAGYTGAVNKLLAEISFVKQLAAQENRYVLFEFNSDGRSYSIKKQQNIADKDSINVLVRSDIFFSSGGSGNEFFDSSSSANYSFVSNSMGMIFKKSEISSTVPNPVPSSITIPVYFKNDDGSFASIDTIIINPSGGVNVKNTKKI